MILGPIFMFVALLMMIGVKRGESQTKKGEEAGEVAVATV
jgi:hypothetical protein